MNSPPVTDAERPTDSARTRLERVAKFATASEAERALRDARVAKALARALDEAIRYRLDPERPYNLPPSPYSRPAAMPESVVQARIVAAEQPSIAAQNSLPGQEHLST